MTALRARLSFTTISTALLLSIIALPVSVVAFVVLYVHNDSLWSVCWLGLVLPMTSLAAAILAIRDALKRRSWRQTALVAGFLVAAVLLLTAWQSKRFLQHQLFSIKPLEAPIDRSPIVFRRKFLVCDKKSPCSPDAAATVTFRLEKVPDRCCSLLVMNGNGSGKGEVETFRVTVNGRPIAFAVDVATRFLAAVDLKQENTIAVELHGAPDAYVQVWLFAPP